MPDFPIIDAHLHIYDPRLLSYPWMKAVPELDRRHGPEDFFAATGGVEVEAAVFVEVDAAPGSHLDEARFVTEAAAAEPRIRGMVAALPFDRRAETERDMATLKAMPLMRGVRQLIERHHEEPGWALREDFVAGVQSLAGHDLSFDLCLYHHQLGEATELVRRCPQVRFVLDHIGKPGVRTYLLDPWRDELRALSRLDNVWCKLSGVVTEADHARWTEAEVMPYLRHAIDCFGFSRLMFGGDWPVSELASPYRRWVDLVDAAIADAMSAEKRRLYRDTAIDFYRL